MDGLQFIVENPVKMDDLGVCAPISGNLHIDVHLKKLISGKQPHSY